MMHQYCWKFSYTQRRLFSPDEAGILNRTGSSCDTRYNHSVINIHVPEGSNSPPSTIFVTMYGPQYFCK